MPFRFGVCVNPVDEPDDFVSLVRQVDDGGFDYFWIADVALLARDIVPFLTLAAANTTHVKIGPAVFHPFVRHPAYSANTMAVLDVISHGRAVLGMGMGGGEIVQELGLPPASMAELRDWVRVTRELLTGRATTCDGGRYALRDARLRFPASRPIPVYIAATGPKMLALGGELAEGVYALVGVHPAAVTYAVQQVRAGAAAGGKDPKAVEVGMYAYTAVARDRRAARDVCRRGAGIIAMRNASYATMAGIGPATLGRLEEAARGAGSTFAPGFAEAVSDDVVSAFALSGTPDDCCRTLEALRPSGIARVDIYLQGPNRAETVRLFTKEVIPHLRSSP
jgi:5,10-methylenetetrahydromethanopterin reductase